MNARCRRVRSWQTRTGWLAALCFCLACLALFDLLKGGFLGNQGIITLLPGSSYAISGPLPQGATGIVISRSISLSQISVVLSMTSAACGSRPFGEITH